MPDERPHHHQHPDLTRSPRRPIPCYSAGMCKKRYCSSATPDRLRTSQENGPASDHFPTRISWRTHPVFVSLARFRSARRITTYVRHVVNRRSAPPHEQKNATLWYAYTLNCSRTRCFSVDKSSKNATRFDHSPRTFPLSGTHRPPLHRIDSELSAYYSNVLLSACRAQRITLI